MTATDGELAGIAVQLRRSGLPAIDQRRMSNSVINSAIEGSTPDRKAVERLIEYTAGRIDFEEYQAQAINALRLM